MSATAEKIFGADLKPKGGPNPRTCFPATKLPEDGGPADRQEQCGKYSSGLVSPAKFLFLSAECVL